MTILKVRSDGDLNEERAMLIHLNGRLIPANEARISPFDRGFLFGDGVYEGIRFFNGQGVGMIQHMERLTRSMQSIGIEGFDAGDVPGIAQQVLHALGTGDAMLYLQVTRGVEIPRRHSPGKGLSPTVFSFATAAPSLEELDQPQGRLVKLEEDLRWRRCDIKSTNLLGNVLAIRSATLDGCDEAILVRDGMVTEGSMTTVFLIRNGVVMTPPVGIEPSILHGITRHMLLEIAPTLDLRTDVRSVAINELLTGDEVFVASSSRLIDAVVSIDGQPIGQGEPGPVTRRLFAALREQIAVDHGVALPSSP